MFSHIVIILFLVFNPNRLLDRICLDLLLPACFPTALVSLPKSAQPLRLNVARYALDETAAHLLNNRTLSVKDSNNRFRFKRTDLALQKVKLKDLAALFRSAKISFFCEYCPFISFEIQTFAR